MLTLQELKRITDMPGYGVKFPTAKQLRESGLAVVQERLGQDSEISAYQNGYVLYRVGNHSTVFPLHSCRGYSYLSGKSTVYLSEQFFYKEKWYLRLVLEGEDRLNRNHEEKERNWNVPYSNKPEEWVMPEDLAESVVEHLLRREAVENMLQILTEKQRTAIQEYYMQEKTQAQISKEMGVSRLAVRDLIIHSVDKIRKRYLSDMSQSSHEMKCGEGM